MADEKMTEKVYCYNHPSQDNSLALATMLGNKQHMDPMALAAMMNNCGGNNAIWQNPFIYLVWMMFAGRMFGNNGWGSDSNGGQAQQNIEVQNQLAAIRSQMSSDQNSNLIMDAVKGNNAAIGQLASNLNCDFNALQCAICDVRGGIDRLGGQVGFSAEKVINAVNLGNASIVSQLQSCCCESQKAILEMGYQNQLANCQQTGTITNAINANGVQNQQNFTILGNQLQQGFSSIGYATQAQTCEIINAGNANTQRIIDTLNCHWQQDLQQRYNDARLELSQLKQNETLIAALKTTNTTA